MKVCLIGNCQIEPLRAALLAMSDNLVCSDLPAVHMMTEEHIPIFEKALIGIDWIFTQLISDEFSLHCVRTQTLRERFGEKVIVFPNLYFIGYAPEYGVVRDIPHANFRGPLFDYHSEKIIFGFMNGIGVTSTVRLISDNTSIDELWYGDFVGNSIQELRSRESQCDVKISDFVHSHFTYQRLFYVMNHPSMFLICEMVRRILARAGHNANFIDDWMLSDREMCFAFHHETPSLRNKFKVAYSDPKYARGYKLARDGAQGALRPLLREPRYYDRQNLVETFFEFYESLHAGLSQNSKVQNIAARNLP